MVMSIVRTHRRFFLTILLVILIACGVWVWVDYLSGKDQAEILTSNSLQGVGEAIPAPGPKDPDTPIQTTEFVPPAAEPCVVFTVMDEISQKHLGAVQLFADSSHKNAIGKSAKDGSVALKKSIAERIGRRCFAELPPALGHRSVMAHVVAAHGVHQLIVAAYARILASLTDPHKDSRTTLPKKGKLWCVAWPKPQEVLGDAGRRIDKSAWKSLERSYHMRAIASDTLEQRLPGIDYYEDLKKIHGCDESQLMVVGIKTHPDQDIMIDIPFKGEVVTDYFLPGFPVIRSRTYAVPGSLSRVDFVIPDPMVLRVRVVDGRNMGLPKAKVYAVVRREIGPDDLPPPQSGVMFIPTGSVRPQFFQMGDSVTDSKGYAKFTFGYSGTIYVSASKKGFVPRGKLLWSNQGAFPSKLFVFTLDNAHHYKSLLRYQGTPVANARDIIIGDAQPAASFLETKFSSRQSDAKGMVDLGDLTPGHRYGIIINTPVKHLFRAFVYQPGMTIDLKLSKPLPAGTTHYGHK